MTERSLAVRLSVRDADRARRELQSIADQSQQTTKAVRIGSQEAAKGVRELARENRRAGQSMSETAEAGRAADRALGAVTKTIENQARRARTLDAAITDLHARWKQGEISAQQFKQSVAALEQQYGETAQSARLLGRQTDNLRSRLSNTLGTVRNLAGRISGVGSIATAVAGGGIAAMATQSIQAASRLDEMSRAAGVNVETLQRLQAAGEDFHVQGEAIADGLRELQVRADEFANQGGGEAAEAFKRLNLQQRDVAANLDNNEKLFRLVIQRVSELDDRASKVSLLDQIFGEEAGRQLLGFLEASRGEIKRIGDEAERAGRIWKEDTVNAATKLENEFQDVADAVQKAFARGTIAAFGGEVGNISQTITDPGFQRGMRAIGEAMGDAAKDASNLVETVGELAAEIKDSDLARFFSFLKENTPGGRLSGLIRGEIGNITGSSEVERIRNRTEQLREQIARMREAGRPVPPQFIDNLAAMEQQLQDLLEPATRTANALDQITITAEPLPALFAAAGEGAEDLATCGGDYPPVFTEAAEAPA
jgi:hypothetical protein